MADPGEVAKAGLETAKSIIDALGSKGGDGGGSGGGSSKSTRGAARSGSGKGSGS